MSGSELTRAPTGTLESALQGKIPGALIQSNSGAPGGGIQVNLRGVATINAGTDPLFVVDGVVISNEAIPNGADAVTAAQAGGNALFGRFGASRFGHGDGPEIIPAATATEEIPGDFAIG